MKNIILLFVSLVAFATFNTWANDIPQEKVDKHLALTCEEVLSGEQVDDKFSEKLQKHMLEELELKSCEGISEAQFSKLVDAEMTEFYSQD